MMRTLCYSVLVTAMTLAGCTPTSDGDDDDSTPNGGTAAMGGSPVEGGTPGMGGEMVEPPAPMGGAMNGNFVDPDEGEPMEYMPPARLDDPIAGGEAEACAEGSTFVSVARGWVVDRIGRPIDQAMVQLCIVANGVSECLTPTDTDANGVFELRTLDGKRCLSKMVFRSIKPAGFRTPAYVNYDLSAANNGDGAAIIRTPFVLYATVPIPEPPVVEDDEAMHTFTFHTGMELDIIPFDLNSASPRLGIREVATDERGLTFLDGHTAPDLLFGLSPDSSVYGSGGTFRIPNTLELAAGAKVDFHFVGGVGCKLDGELIKEGDWTHFGTGTVSADGATIASDEGTGLTCVSWLGVTAQ